MTEIAPFSEKKSCPRLCQVHLYWEKLITEVKVLILPFGIFLFPKNVEKTKIANQWRIQTFTYRLGWGGGGGKGGHPVPEIRGRSVLILKYRGQAHRAPPLHQPLQTRPSASAFTLPPVIDTSTQ